MVYRSKNILLFRKQKLLGIIFYLLCIQVVLSSLTNKDLLLISNALVALGADLGGFAYQNIILSNVMSPLVETITRIPEILIILVAIGALLAGSMILFFCAGFVVSLILRLFQE